jgi:hypothetical protein
VWAQPVKHKLSQQYGWEDVKPLTDLPKQRRPPEAYWKPTKSIIATEGGPAENPNIMNLEHIVTDKPTWPLQDSEGFLNKAAVAYSHKKMSESGEWDPDVFWIVDLLPEKQVLRRNDTNELFMLVESFASRSALILNLKLGANNLIEFPTTAQNVDVGWLTVTDEHSIMVLNTKATSPLHLRYDAAAAVAPADRIKAASQANVCIAIKKLAGVVELPVWHARRGFDGVRSETLRRLVGYYQEKGAMHSY